MWFHHGPWLVISCPVVSCKFSVMPIYSMPRIPPPALSLSDQIHKIYLNISLKGESIGQMIFALFTDTAPLAAENFRSLCLGEQVGG